MDFEVMDGFEVVLVDELLGTRECEGFRGAGALREPIDSNKFPHIVNLLNIYAFVNSEPSFLEA